MKKKIATFNGFERFFSCVMALILILQAPSYAQEGSYSTMAQRILDNQNASNTDGATAIDVFKFWSNSSNTKNST